MLTKTQLTFAADMLHLAYNYFINHEYNNYAIAATPVNIAFVQSMIKAGDYPDDALKLSEGGQIIYVMDWEIMIYCRDLLRQAAEEAKE